MPDFVSVRSLYPLLCCSLVTNLPCRLYCLCSGVCAAFPQRMRSDYRYFRPTRRSVSCSPACPSCTWQVAACCMIYWRGAAVTRIGTMHTQSYFLVLIVSFSVFKLSFLRKAFACVPILCLQVLYDIIEIFLL